jgi:hypothetical protein
MPGNAVGFGLAAVLLIAGSGCAGTGASPALAYRLPDPRSAEYRMADTVRVEIEAMGRSFAVQGGACSDWSIDFGTDPGGVRVTATLVDLDARMSDPLGPGPIVDESEVAGPVVFTLDRRGSPTVQRVPELGAGAARFFTGAAIAHGFFPRLPGRVLAPGESWADTVSFEASEASSHTAVRTLWTYTAAGDTTVDGLDYLLVRARGETEQSSSGRVAGADFTQSVSGPVEGKFLWDGEAGLLHSSEYESDLSGTTELSIAPLPLEVKVSSAVRVSRTSPSQGPGGG